MRPLLRYARDCRVPTATAQQKGAFVGGDGRVHFFTKKAVVDAENGWADILRPAREVFGPPLAGPVALRIDLLFPYVGATPKRVRAIGEWTPLDRRPDLDNLLKALLDTMTRLAFWLDDGQIYALEARKLRAPTPGLRLEIAVPDEAPSLFGRRTVDLDTTAAARGEEAVLQ